MKNVEKQIIDIINEIRPFLNSDGGDVEFIKYEDNIVYVKLLGACSGCHMASVTLNDVIEATLINEIPEIKKVINLN